MHFFGYPIVSGANGCDWCEENPETSHERQERGGAVDDLPGHHDPSCGDGRDDHAASDIDVFGEEGGHIVGAGDDVGG